MLDEVFVFFILERIQLIQVFVLQSVLIRSALGLDQGFLDQGFGVFRFLWDDSMLTKDIIPVSICMSEKRYV